MEAKQPEALTLKSNLIWNSVGNFIYLISQWLFTYLVTIALGFEGAGIYSLAVSICTTFYTISAYGMRNYQASDISHEYADSTYVESRYLTSLIALVGCALFSLLTGYAWQTLCCIALYMLFKLTESVSDVYQGVVQLRMRMDYVGKSFIAKGVLELATFGSCLFISRDLTLPLSAQHEPGKQQDANLVSGQQAPTIPIGHGNAKSVGVRIGRQGEVTTFTLSKRYDLVHGFGELGVGLRTRRKYPVFMLLLGHDEEVAPFARNTQIGEGGKDRLKPRPAQRAVRNPQAGAVRRTSAAQHRVAIVAEHIVGNDSRGGVGTLHILEDINRFNRSLDLRAHLGRGLASIRSVHLEAVVLTRVVRCRNHNASRATEFADRERQHGSGNGT